MLREDMKALIRVLAHGENAMSLTELQQQSGLPITRVTEALDMLVQIRIFKADTSRHASDIGEVVYMFADNEQAQQAYQAAIDGE